MAALLVFADHPLVGVGPGQFKYYSAEYGNRLGLRILEGTREAHSLYLGIAADYGIFGLLAFLAVCLLPIWTILRARHALSTRQPELNNLALGFAFAMIAYLASGLFLHLAYVRYFWLILALVDSAAYMAQRAAEEELEPVAWRLRFLRRRQHPAAPAGETG
jgi:putative inorganic carbon (hco3(-)) transporter